MKSWHITIFEGLKEITTWLPQAPGAHNYLNVWIIIELSILSPYTNTYVAYTVWPSLIAFFIADGARKQKKNLEIRKRFSVAKKLEKLRPFDWTQTSKRRLGSELWQARPGTTAGRTHKAEKRTQSPQEGRQRSLLPAGQWSMKNGARETSRQSAADTDAKVGQWSESAHGWELGNAVTHWWRTGAINELNTFHLLWWEHR